MYVSKIWELYRKLLAESPVKLPSRLMLMKLFKNEKAKENGARPPASLEVISR